MIVFLLLPLIYGVKNLCAGLSFEEQYQHFKNKRKNISKSEYYKRFQERNKFLKEQKI